MRRLLVLRPEPGATVTLRRARELGLDAIAVPLFRVEAVDWSAPEANALDGLLLTSANAVRHGGSALRALRDLPAFAVGQATAEAARAAGFTVAAVGEKGVDQLLARVQPELQLLHLCGEGRRPPVKPSQQITAVSVYRAIPIEAPDLSAAAGAVALIHSPRAGRRLAELVDERSRTPIAAISPAAAEAVGTGWAEVESAAEQTDDALLALAARLCNKPAPE